MRTIERGPPRQPKAHSRAADAVAAELSVDPDQGLGPGDVEQRLSEYGPASPAPSGRSRLALTRFP